MKGEEWNWVALSNSLLINFIYYNSWYLKVPWSVRTCTGWNVLSHHYSSFSSEINKCYAHQTLTSKKNLMELKSIRTIKHNSMPYYKTENQAGYFSLILLNIHKTSLVLNPSLSAHKLFDTPLFKRWSLFLFMCMGAGHSDLLLEKSQYFKSDATWLSGLGHKSEATWLIRLIPPEKIQSHKSSPGTQNKLFEENNTYVVECTAWRTTLIHLILANFVRNFWSKLKSLGKHCKDV